MEKYFSEAAAMSHGKLKLISFQKGKKLRLKIKINILHPVFFKECLNIYGSWNKFFKLLAVYVFTQITLQLMHSPTAQTLYQSQT
jgi:hypothetical protein